MLGTLQSGLLLSAAAALSLALPALAQDNGYAQAPFLSVCEMSERVAEQNNASKSKTCSTDKLKYKRKFPKNRDVSAQLRAELTNMFGAEKSVRGPSHVWELDNPSKGGKQSDTITIILMEAESGRPELRMDRARGRDGRETRMKPVQQKRAMPALKRQSAPKPATTKVLDSDKL